MTLCQETRAFRPLVPFVSSPVAAASGAPPSRVTRRATNCPLSCIFTSDIVRGVVVLLCRCLKQSVLPRTPLIEQQNSAGWLARLLDDDDDDDDDYGWFRYRQLLGLLCYHTGRVKRRRQVSDRRAPVSTVGGRRGAAKNDDSAAAARPKGDRCSSWRPDGPVPRNSVRHEQCVACALQDRVLLKRLRPDASSCSRHLGENHVVLMRTALENLIPSSQIHSVSPQAIGPHWSAT